MFYEPAYETVDTFFYNRGNSNETVRLLCKDKPAVNSLQWGSRELSRMRKKQAKICGCPELVIRLSAKVDLQSLYRSSEGSGRNMGKQKRWSEILNYISQISRLCFLFWTSLTLADQCMSRIGKVCEVAIISAWFCKALLPYLSIFVGFLFLQFCSVSAERAVPSGATANELLSFRSLPIGSESWRGRASK
jgi:hypothetical protein